MTELRCKIPHICTFCKKKFKGFKKEFSNGNSLHLLMLSRIYIALFLLWFNFLRCDILNWHPPLLVISRISSHKVWFNLYIHWYFIINMARFSINMFHSFKTTSVLDLYTFLLFIIKYAIWLLNCVRLE